MISKDQIPNRKTGEKIVLHLRRHWFIFFRIFLMFLGLLLAPVVIYTFLKFNFADAEASEIVHALVLVFGFSYYLIMLVFLLTLWTENYLDVWTVTTERIINREQNGLFNRVVSELDHYRVQDVTAEQKGIFPTLFHYGNVYVQSAATTERFVFEQITDPYKVGKIIQQLDERSKEGHHLDDIGLYDYTPTDDTQKEPTKKSPTKDNS